VVARGSGGDVAAALGLTRNPHPDRKASPLEADPPRPPGVLHAAANLKWDRTLHVAVYREHVSHRTRKNFQLDLFDSNGGHYEYSSVASNKRISLRALWDFMVGRGGHEKTLGELKQHLAFDAIPVPGPRLGREQHVAADQRAHAQRLSSVPDHDHGHGAKERSQANLPLGPRVAAYLPVRSPQPACGAGPARGTCRAEDRCR
jgi:hypothetical protein